MNASDIAQWGLLLKTNVQQVIVGKDDTIDLFLISLIASGHVLLEDVPGTGKTMMAKAFAKSLACSFKRVQFTPDLLPSDLTGIHFYNQQAGQFQFRQGPLFTQILLADEINRATPRTQSSLLECMEERQITIDGETHFLERPFMVIATQNPIENQGTFPLPEAQLDRFLLKIPMQYPTTQEGIDILKRFKKDAPFDTLLSVMDVKTILAMQEYFCKVTVCEELMSYIVNIVERTRSHPDVILGVSPRGSLALLHACQAYAALKGRDFITPDDVLFLAKPVLAHRLLLSATSRIHDHHADRVIDSILQTTPVPSEIMG